jgi:PAS domain S-box-containing protein
MKADPDEFNSFEPEEDWSGLNIALMEAASDRIWVVNKDYCLFYGNRIFQEHTALINGKRLKRGEYLFSNIASQKYIQEWKALYDRVLFHGETFSTEIETGAFQPSRFIEYSFSPVYSKVHEVTAALIIGRDITEKKVLSQAVIESENMYRTMFENTWAVKLLINPENGHIIDANEAAARFYGYPRHELVKMGIEEFNTMDSGEIRQLMLNVLEEGSAYFQFKHRIADGRIRDVEVYSSVIEIKERKILHSIIHDITERIHAEHALRHSESNARAIMESTDDVIILLHVDGKIIDCNEAHAKRLNKTREQLIGACAFDFLPKSVSDLRKGFMEQAYRTGNPVHFEDIRDHRWNEISMYPIYDGNQKTTRITVFSRDITERKRMLELLEQKNNQLLESETRFRKIFEESSIGIALVNNNFHFISANEVFCKMFGYNLDELKLMTFKDLTHPDFLEKDLEAIKKLINGDLDVYRTEKQYITKSRNTTWASVNISIIKDANGKFLNILALVADINKRKNAEKALMESEASLRATNATKDRFFSIIAHDLKSPINGILGLSTLLKEDAKNLDINTITQFASMINATAQNTYQLLDDLLGWARLQQGQIPFEPGIFSLNELMGNILDEQQPVAYQKMVELTAEIPKTLTLFADINMVRTILRNLISNAIKFTAKNGRIRVVANQSPGQTIISVSDTGVGMSEETTGKLFRIETSFSSRGTENEKGTGLGLLLCKEFAEKHGGKIWVESKLAKGSTFYITIPDR